MAVQEQIIAPARAMTVSGGAAPGRIVMLQKRTGQMAGTPAVQNIGPGDQIGLIDNDRPPIVCLVIGKVN